METCTVKLKGLEVELDCYVDDGIAYVEEVLATDTVSEQVADFLFQQHEQELNILAQNKLDEAAVERKRQSRYGNMLMHDIARLTHKLYGV